MKNNLPMALKAKNVRTLAAPGRPGVYLLGTYEKRNRMFSINYVGRSDTCVRKRLLRHQKIRTNEYVKLMFCRDSREAYFMEAYVWHMLQYEHWSLNKIHPAAPSTSNLVCPYCAFGNEIRSLLRRKGITRQERREKALVSL
jgi:hypothetical protein